MPRKKKSSEPQGRDAREESATATGSEAARPDPQRIAARAYELYLQRGGGEGRAMDDWLAAEGELTKGKRD